MTLPFPWDNPNEQVRIAATELDRLAERATAIATSLRALVGQELALSLTVVQQAERQADARAEERAAALPPPIAEPEPVFEERREFSPVTGPGWSCPTHGTDHLTSLTARGGRTYRACTACEEFQR